MDEENTEKTMEKADSGIAEPSAPAASQPPKPDSQQIKVSLVVDKKKLMIGAAAVAAIALAYVVWILLQPVVIAARVNGKTISRLDVIRELERQGGTQALDGIISDRLLTEKAAAENLTVSASDAGAEVEKLKTQLSANGQTLDEYLSSQGITLAYLEERLDLRLMLERLLADKTAVTDAEIDAFIKDNKDSIPKGTDTSSPAFREQVKNQLSDQKFSSAASDYMSNLRSSADIQYVHKY